MPVSGEITHSPLLSTDWNLLKIVIMKGVFQRISEHIWKLNNNGGVPISWHFPDNPLRQLIKCCTQRQREISTLLCLCEVLKRANKIYLQSPGLIKCPPCGVLQRSLGSACFATVSFGFLLSALNRCVAVSNGPFDTTPFCQHQCVWALRKKAICCGRQGWGKHIFPEKYPHEGTLAKEPRSKLSLDWALPWQAGGIYLEIFFVRKMTVRQCKERAQGSDFNLFLICESSHSSPCFGTARLVCQESWSGAKLRPE